MVKEINYTVQFLIAIAPSGEFIVFTFFFVIFNFLKNALTWRKNFNIPNNIYEYNDLKKKDI